MMQTTTATCLIAFIIKMREISLRLVNKENVTVTELKNLQEDYEYILTKHTDALHKRCSLAVYPPAKKNGEEIEIYRDWKSFNKSFIEQLITEAK
tara:strand:- start:6599 stop:6883 length:285 start_codon:yes stop_codon:yes gene_type:complete